jgi:murein DD-endopeptidase MepM/ murein hydrolase activator NlpD
MDFSENLPNDMDPVDNQVGYVIDPKILLAAVFIVSLGMFYIFTRVTVVSAGESPESWDDATFLAPYDDYVITQGLHGFSYGHMAVDLSAGKGAIIKSPVSGVVTEHFVDNLGNTTLVIENDHYRVLLLHGKYTVSKGDRLQAGQPIGKESNQGYTTDMAGRPCQNRECGYHSHLNVYNKLVEMNVNPLELFAP